MLLVPRYGAQPIEKTVARVTPKGWFRLEGLDKTFKPSSHTINDCFVAIGSNKWSQEAVYPLTKIEELRKNALEHEIREAEKRAKERKRQEEYDVRIAAELTTVKSLLPELPITFQKNLPDGSAMLWLTIPVKAEYAERKVFEEVIVRLKPTKETDWDDQDGPLKTDKIAVYITYANASNSSFPSCSGSARFENAEVALWEVIRDRYFGGW